LDAYYEKSIRDESILWECVRTNVYFSYLYTPTKGSKVSYNTFKKDYFPLNTDKEEIAEVLTDESVTEILDFMNKVG